MTNLTTFSKLLIILSIVGFFSLFGIMCYTCAQNQPSYPQQQSYQQSSPIQDYGDYQVVGQPGGSQVVVVKDHSGSEFLMDMIQFQMLMNMAGGINNVYGYYNQHRYDPDWGRDQSTYRSKTKAVINNYYGSSFDDSKPISDQVKQKEVEYKKSNGFSKPTTSPTTGSTSTSSENQSKGFTNKWFSTPTNTPSPTYNRSNGFSKPKIDHDAYKPSPGFNSTPTYKPSSGFKPSTGSSYKPSGGFRKSNNSSYKSSSGFGKRKN